MNELPSTEFRKRFARLTQVTRVTVNGHLIGEWTPMGLSAVIEKGELKAVRDTTRQASQAERDAILRRITARNRER